MKKHMNLAWLVLALMVATAAAQTGTVPLDAGTPPSGLTNSSITELNGNVGIGTSPKSLLHGYQAATNAVGQMQSSVQGAYWAVITPTVGTNVYRGFVGADGTSNHFLVGQYVNSSEDMIGFYTGTSLTERMRIMNSGNVGSAPRLVPITTSMLRAGSTVQPESLFLTGLRRVLL